MFVLPNQEIQCYICKNFGHLCCVNFVDTSASEVSCYRCGQLGHTGLVSVTQYAQCFIRINMVNGFHWRKADLLSANLVQHVGV